MRKSISQVRAVYMLRLPATYKIRFCPAVDTREGRLWPAAILPVCQNFNFACDSCRVCEQGDVGEYDVGRYWVERRGRARTTGKSENDGEAVCGTTANSLRRERGCRGHKQDDVGQYHVQSVGMENESRSHSVDLHWIKVRVLYALRAQAT